jgi:hypothetical protein
VLPEIVTEAERAVRAYDGEDLRRALLVAGKVYLLARSWCNWVGEHDLALLCAERALSVAERGSDAALLGATAWTMSHALSIRGETAESRAVAGDAIGLLAEDAGSGHAPVELLSAWGALHLIGMIGAVRDGDQADGRQLLAGASRAAARLGADRNDFRTAFGPTNVSIHYVSYSVELGHSRSAVQGASAVDLRGAPSVERRVSHRIDVAQSQVRLRDDLPALRGLAEAEQESPEQVYYSPTVRAILREMLRRESSTSRPLLRPLAERVGVLT